MVLFSCLILILSYSPIRRYADIVVHRLLAAAIGYCGIPKADSRKVQRVARHINHRHRMAQMAGRASAEIHSKKVLLSQGPRTLSCTVLAVQDDGVRCVVPSLGIEVLVPTTEPVNILDTLTIVVKMSEDSDKVIASLASSASKKMKK